MVDVALHARGPGKRHLDEKAVQKALKAVDAPVAGTSPRDIASLARVISIVWDVVEELPTVERRQVVGDSELLRAAIRQIWSHRKALLRRKGGTDAVERSRGAGLGQQIGVEEGRARLDRYSTVRPLESWAGPVAGAGESERALGIPRSTLSNWRSRGVAVGLPHGERKLAYPLLTHESIRAWCRKLGAEFAKRLPRRRPRPGDPSPLEEGFIRLNGVLHDRWRAVDQHGGVRDILVQEKPDGAATKCCFRRRLKRLQSRPMRRITDGLRSCGVARRALLPDVKHRTSRFLKNRAAHAHLSIGAQKGLWRKVGASDAKMTGISMEECRHEPWHLAGRLRNEH